MRNYKTIKAWQLGDDLTVEVYKLSSNFPKDELYAMTSQIRRAAYSVPANIAEGAGRRTQKDYLRFLDITRGSLNETEYFLHLAYRLSYIDKVTLDSITKYLISTSKCLNGLIRAVELEL